MESFVTKWAIYENATFQASCFKLKSLSILIALHN